MNISARSALGAFFLLSTLTGVPLGHSGEYYIYRDVKDGLVISNQKPPPGSQIIRQRTFPDEADNEPSQPQNHIDAPINDQAPKSARTR